MESLLVAWQTPASCCFWVLPFRLSSAPLQTKHCLHKFVHLVSLQVHLKFSLKISCHISLCYSCLHLKSNAGGWRILIECTPLLKIVHKHFFILLRQDNEATAMLATTLQCFVTLTYYETHIFISRWVQPQWKCC